MDKKHLTVLVFSLMAPSCLMASDSMFMGGFMGGMEAFKNFEEKLKKNNSSKNQDQRYERYDNKKDEDDGLSVIDKIVKETVRSTVRPVEKNNDGGRITGRAIRKSPSGGVAANIPQMKESPSIVIKRKEVFSEKLKNYLNTRLAEGTGFKVLRESKKLTVKKVFFGDKKYYTITFDDNVILKCNNKVQIVNGVGFKCSSGKDINICFDASRGKCQHDKWYNINEVLGMKYDKLVAELNKTHLALFYKNDEGEDVEKLGSSVYGIYTVKFETVPVDNAMSDSLRTFSPGQKNQPNEYNLKVHCIGKVCTLPVKIIRLVRVNDELRKKFLLSGNVDKKGIMKARTGLSGNMGNVKKISSSTSSCLKGNLERLLSGDNPLKCGNSKEVNVKRMFSSGKNTSIFSSFTCKKGKMCVKYSSVPEEYMSCTQNIQWYPYREEFKYVKEYDRDGTGVCVIPEPYKKTISYEQEPVLNVHSGRDCSVAYTSSVTTYKCQSCSENEDGEVECVDSTCTSTNSYSYTTGVCNRWDVYSWSVRNKSRKIRYSNGVRPQYTCASNNNLDDMTKQFIFYTVIGSKRLPIYSDWAKWAKNILNNGNFFTILDNHLNYKKFIKGSNPETLAGMKEKDIEVVSHYCSILGGSKCSKEIIKEFLDENDLVYPSKAAYELNKNDSNFVKTLSKLNCVLDLHVDSVGDAAIALKMLNGGSTNFKEFFELFQNSYVKDSFYNPMYNVNYPVEVRYDALLRVEEGNQ